MEENTEISKSNKIKIIVITALIFLVSIAGISYAYFTIQITGNDTASSMRLRTANMSLVYNDVQIVSGEYATPGWSDTKTLTVTNNGNVTAYYTIIWRDLLNEVTNNELVISATCSSSSGSCPAISETAVPTNLSEVHNVKVKRNISIAPGVTHTYALTAEFKETGSNQNYNQNKYFNGTLNIADGTEPATLSLQTDSGTNGLSKGDVVRATKTGMDNQDFYVVSTSASKTVLLAKYNLLVGDVLDVNSDGDQTLNKTMNSSNTSGYGLQSSTAKGVVLGDSQYIGATPFAGIDYWDDGNGNLINQYGTAGASYNGNPYPNVYNSGLSSIAPSISRNSYYGVAQNNGYTIAYYVEEYVDRIGVDGVGRLLTYEEEQTLASSNSSIVFNGTAYWLGSAYDTGAVWMVNSNNSLIHPDPVWDEMAVRPVIVVNTSDIQSS